MQKIITTQSILSERVREELEAVFEELDCDGSDLTDEEKLITVSRLCYLFSTIIDDFDEAIVHLNDRVMSIDEFVEHISESRTKLYEVLIGD